MEGAKGISLAGWVVDRENGNLRIDQERTFFTPKDLKSNVYDNLEAAVSKSGFSGNKFWEHKGIRESYRQDRPKNSMQIGFSENETFIEIDIDPNNPHYWRRFFPHAWDVVKGGKTNPYDVANRRYWECKPQKKGGKK